MSFDFAKTLTLTKGGLLDHEATWKSYLDENPGWQQTAMVLTGPLIVANLLFSILLARLMGGFSYYLYPGNIFVVLLSGLVMAVAGFVIAVFVVNFLAGVFKGKPNFSRAFAALSLAFIPAWIAGIIGALVPWVGFLISLAGGILSLIFLYKIIPLALEVPSSGRLVHFVVSLLAIIIINVVIGMVFFGGAMDSGIPDRSVSRSEQSDPPVAGGFIGELERQGRLMEEAGSDIYEPPDDEELTEKQLTAYVSVLGKARAAQESYAQEMQDLAAEIEAKNEAGEMPSPADLSRLYSGVGTTLGAQNAEMEIVKTGGGNWAEHQWVKQQLRVARLQQGEGTEAIAHNYALYSKYEDELKDLY